MAGLASTPFVIGLGLQAAEEMERQEEEMRQALQYQGGVAWTEENITAELDRLGEEIAYIWLTTREEDYAATNLESLLAAEAALAELLAHLREER